MKKLKEAARSSGLLFLFVFMAWPALVTAMDNGECFDCHSDETLTRENNEHGHINNLLFVDEARFNRSVHHISGLFCVDCHADIEALDYDNEVPHARQLAPVQCGNCHSESEAAFAASAHMQIRSKGISMTCYACHDYHYVTHLAGASVAEREDNFCAKCHNPHRSHDWLPKKEEHFAFVECTVCHAPEVPRHIHLKFFDLMTNKFYQGDEILEILGISYEQFMPLLDTDKDGILSRQEFEALELMLRQKNVHAIFHVELVAEMDPAAHQVTAQGAERNCEKCHTPESPYFNAVTIALPKKDGSVDHHRVERAVLESYSLRHFYIYAGTRVKLLDWIGIVLLGGAACGVLGHLTIRILTIRLRRNKDK